VTVERQVDELDLITTLHVGGYAALRTALRRDDRFDANPNETVRRIIDAEHNDLRLFDKVLDNGDKVRDHVGSSNLWV
jgi:hypothetical protein